MKVVRTEGFCGCSRDTESSDRLRVCIPSTDMRPDRGERGSSREPVRVITCSATRSRKLHMIDLSVAPMGCYQGNLKEGSKAYWKGEGKSLN